MPKIRSARPRTSTTAYALIPLPHPVVKARGMSSAPTSAPSVGSAAGAPVRLVPGRTTGQGFGCPDAVSFTPVGATGRAGRRCRRGLAAFLLRPVGPGDVLEPVLLRAAERARSASGWDPCTPPFADRTREAHSAGARRRGT